MKWGRILAAVGVIAILYWLGVIPDVIDVLERLLEGVKGVGR